MLDSAGKYGQVRRLDLDRKEARKKDLQSHPPVGLLQLVVWMEPGVFSVHFCIACACASLAWLAWNINLW